MKEVSDWDLGFENNSIKSNTMNKGKEIRG
jgi:hypothetical protein